MYIRMQFPEIAGNRLCDGTIHQINPSRLRRVTGRQLFVLEYFDNKYKIPCLTIILQDGENFYKVPLLGYEELYEELEHDDWLEPADIRILPDMIGTLEPVYNWPELLADSQPTPACTPPIMLSPADPGCPPQPPQTLSNPERKVITLYIKDAYTLHKIMRRDDNHATDFVFRAIPYRTLYEMLNGYDIEWRHIDETFATKKREINVILRACESKLSNEGVFYWIQEIDIPRNPFVRRYKVDVL